MCEDAVLDGIVCIGLGGTKIDLGCWVNGQPSTRIYQSWQRTGPFARHTGDTDATAFCGSLIAEISRLLEEAATAWPAVRTVGVAFPGPNYEGRWFSNNLIPPFTEGVSLESLLRQCIAAEGGHPQVRVALDAQCDAGGELYASNGRLFGYKGSATVLNLATGVAAGFIADGRVLTSDAAFRHHVGPMYDGGAGQLGRHLWFTPESSWRYAFTPGGQTPDGMPGQRMTDRLSGPALAARLVQRLLEALGEAKARETVSHAQLLLEDCRDPRDSSAVLNAARKAPRDAITALLMWADEQACTGHGAERDCAVGLAQEVANELADAIRCWCESPGWLPFADRIVLTGGVGIHLFARYGDYMETLQTALPDRRIERSSLHDAALREVLLFAHQGDRWTSS